MKFAIMLFLIMIVDTLNIRLITKSIKKSNFMSRNFYII